MNLLASGNTIKESRSKRNLAEKVAQAEPIIIKTTKQSCKLGGGFFHVFNMRCPNTSRFYLFVFTRAKV